MFRTEGGAFDVFETTHDGSQCLGNGIRHQHTPFGAKSQREGNMCRSRKVLSGHEGISSLHHETHGAPHVDAVDVVRRVLFKLVISQDTAKGGGI